ncbi:MAG: hypothetical protein RRC07_12535 [Anaerolineae bacterium]|nr:hypothetical protein [Anaerolineae bacterium]
MNRSALNAEVEYRLRMYESERTRHSHAVPEMEEERRGFLSRLVVLLKKGRNRQPQLEWIRTSRPVAKLK